jgi:hypothetical protein
MRSFLKNQLQVKQVSELIVLKDVNNSLFIWLLKIIVLLLLVLQSGHHANEPIFAVLTIFIALCYAKIKQTLNLLCELREFNEYVLLLSQLQEVIDIYLSKVEKLWVRIIAHSEYKNVTVVCTNETMI